MSLPIYESNQLLKIFDKYLKYAKEGILIPNDAHLLRQMEVLLESAYNVQLPNLRKRSFIQKIKLRILKTLTIAGYNAYTINWFLNQWF